MEKTVKISDDIYVIFNVHAAIVDKSPPEKDLFIDREEFIPLALALLKEMDAEIIKSHNDRVQQFLVPADSTVIIIRKEATK